MLRLVLIIIFYFVCHLVSAQKQIVIEGSLCDTCNQDSIRFRIYPITMYDYHPNPIEKVYSIRNGRVKFEISSDSAILIGSQELFTRDVYYFQPGDSISFVYRNGSIYFSGKGADKLNLQGEVFALQKKFPKLLSGNNQLDKFLKTSYLYDSLSRARRAILQKYKPLLNKFDYTFLEAEILSSGEHHRMNAFDISTHPGVTREDLQLIFDTTIGKSEVNGLEINDTSILSPSFSFYHCRVYNIYALARYEKFSEEFQSLTDIERDVKLYNFTKLRFSGLALRKALTTVLTVYMMRKGGITEEYLSCIKDFLDLPGFIEHKRYIKWYMERVSRLEKGDDAPNSILTNTLGEAIDLKKFEGKTIVLDFWFTGCKGCVQLTPALKNVEEYFKNDSSVIFVSISTDKDKNIWKKSIQQGKYTTGKAYNLFTSGKGIEHPIISMYNISSYPRIFVIDPFGKIAAVPSPDPREDGGIKLIQLLNRQIAISADGPYIFYKEDKIISKSIVPKSGKLESKYDTFLIHDRSKIKVYVSTDVRNKKFEVNLKESVRHEPCTFQQSGKVFVISDIEGNFGAFRKLLQGNKIIDSNLKWSFGDGHLVLLGDFFDRGTQVTECLWLIYKLEEEAKKTKGYVHFILGNHEVMNLNGKVNYVSSKYFRNAEILSEKYPSFWGRETELGKWLRTKNVVEKIGDVLFMHGGASDEFNKLKLPLETINQIVQKYIDNEKAIKQSNNKVENILFGSQSPFWYRGYYESDDGVKAKLLQITTTLDQFNVRRIVTGHTIVANTISFHYDGKVVNTDTYHANGKSEALLILGRNYFRVTVDGKSHPLFVQDNVDRIIVSD